MAVLEKQMPYWLCESKPYKMRCWLECQVICQYVRVGKYGTKNIVDEDTQRSKSNTRITFRECGIHEKLFHIRKMINKMKTHKLFIRF